jgi:uncharacterized protein YggE
VNYSLSGQVSPALAASQQCPYALLVADAQGEAQRLAAAAGRSVGAVVAVSDGSELAAAGVLAYVSGSFSSLSGILGAPTSVPPATCGMTVRFSLGN